MSHICVTVCVKVADGTDLWSALEQALAPFDESLEVEPYPAYLAGAPEDFWAAPELAEEGLLSAEGFTWSQLAEAYNASDFEDGEPILIAADGRPYIECTANPHGQWGRWEFGGRFAGRLVTVDGRRVNDGRRDQLDFEAMRSSAGGWDSHVPGDAMITVDGTWKSRSWSGDDTGYYRSANAYLDSLAPDVHVFVVDFRR
jgi:hypothetical protein